MTGSELFPIVTDSVKPVGSAVGGTLAEVWQGILGDRVTAWRIKNAASINEKLGQHLAKTGQTLNLDKLPASVAYSWFQRAGPTSPARVDSRSQGFLTDGRVGP